MILSSITTRSRDWSLTELPSLGMKPNWKYHSEILSNVRNIFDQSESRLEVIIDNAIIFERLSRKDWQTAGGYQLIEWLASYLKNRFSYLKNVFSMFFVDFVNQRHLNVPKWKICMMTKMNQINTTQKFMSFWFVIFNNISKLLVCSECKGLSNDQKIHFRKWIT